MQYYHNKSNVYSYNTSRGGGGVDSDSFRMGASGGQDLGDGQKTMIRSLD